MLQESDVDFVYKKLYPYGLDQDCLMRDNELLKWMKHDKDFTSQKGIEIPVPYSNPQGIGPDNATAVLAEEPSQGVSFTVPQRHVIAYGKIKATVVRNAAAGDNDSQFADAVEKEVDGTTESLGQELNMRSYGSNDGIRSYVHPTQPVNTTTLYLTNVEDMQLYGPRMRIQFVNPSNGTLRSATALRIEGMGADGQLTLSAAPNSVGAVAGDGIVRYGMLGLDLDGIKGWCPNTVASTGDNFMGVNRYLFRNQLAGLYVNRSNLPIRSGLISGQAYARGQIGTKFKKNSPIFINPKGSGQLQQTLEATRVVNDSKETEYGIGIPTIKMLGFEFVEDPHAPVDECIQIAPGALIRGSCGDQPYIEKHDGNRFWYNRQSGYIEFTLAHDGNVYSKEPYNIMRTKISAVAA